MKKTRAQARERAAMASTLVLPATGEQGMDMLARSKSLTDLLVCWMHRSGYEQLTVDLADGVESGLVYHVTLRSRRETEKAE